jgi:Protein of unknown function DUF262
LRLIPSDPDIQTIIGRIRDGSLDLQPEFQRGSVWSKPKQRLLVDSVLRDWYVPPVHLVRTEDGNQVVLDGQQRLRAIDDFVRGLFRVDGDTDPSDDAIQQLAELRYDELPGGVKRHFDRFTVRVFELIDYLPEEPYELFFRLNQPTTLTAAEKRNAFFGDTRRQVNMLTEYAESAGMIQPRIGFSNRRFAYEDVIARFVATVEIGTLNEKVTAGQVTARYRSAEALSDETMDLAATALKTVFGTPGLDDPDIRLNKATAYSWLIYAGRTIARDIALDHFDDYFEWFEHTRVLARSSETNLSTVDRVGFAVFNDRATARVNDVSSVVLRDVVLWALPRKSWPGSGEAETRAFRSALRGKESTRAAEAALSEVADDLEWPDLW